MLPFRVLRSNTERNIAGITCHLRIDIHAIPTKKTPSGTLYWVFTFQISNNHPCHFYTESSPGSSHAFSGFNELVGQGHTIVACFFKQMKNIKIQCVNNFTTGCSVFMVDDKLHKFNNVEMQVLFSKEQSLLRIFNTCFPLQPNSPPLPYSQIQWPLMEKVYPFIFLDGEDDSSSSASQSVHQ